MTGAGFISLVGGISRTPHPAPRTAFTQSP